MADHDKAPAHEAENAEQKQRGIPPEMEEAEAKGGPGDDTRLQSETAHGKPDGGKERNPTGEGS